MTSSFIRSSGCPESVQAIRAMTHIDSSARSGRQYAAIEQFEAALQFA
jgi:hypothetical protein